MNRTEIERFRASLSEIEDRYEKARHSLITKWCAAHPDKEYEDIKDTLEAQARAYCLDPLLNALGWATDRPDQMAAEDIVEPIHEGAHRRFLDYHGREFNDEKLTSLLIVEAKRPSTTMPADDAADVPRTIAEALMDIEASKGKGTQVVRGEWVKYLKDLTDYVERVKDGTGAAPKRVTITNGTWFIVFEDPSDTFLNKMPSAELIHAFSDFRDIKNKIKSFLSHLHYQELSDLIPPQQPVSIRNFVEPGTQITALYACEIEFSKYGAKQPSLSMRPFVYAMLPNGTVITFEKNYPETFIPFHTGKYWDLSIDELSKRLSSIIDELSRYTQVVFIPAHKAAKNIPEKRHGPETFIGGQYNKLCYRTNEERYCVITSDKMLYISEDSTFDACPYHHYGLCKKGGEAHGECILGPSTDPRTLFEAGNKLHCAHAAVHNSIKTNCLISGFETYLCCRNCTFFVFCSQDKDLHLPCIKEQPAP